MHDYRWFANACCSGIEVIIILDKWLRSTFSYYEWRTQKSSLKYNDANFQLQSYNKDKSYLESFNGASIWTKIPYNFGNSQSANHLFLSSLQLVRREQLFKTNTPSNTIFPKPDEGLEGSINLSYLFVKKRLHIRNTLSPNQGFGFKISFKNT